MATDKSLKFFRAAEAPASAAVGAIWFDTTNRTIQIKTGASSWEPYAGKLNDASWDYSAQTLTITKYDGSSIVLDFKNVATLANVSAAISAAVTPVAGRVTTLEETVNGKEGTVGLVTKVANNAQAIKDEKSARESADTALGGRIDGVVSNLSAETAARTQADAEHDRRLGVIEGKVDGLASATHFLGVKQSLDEVTNPANGDIVIVGQKEYVYTTNDNAWHELGDTSSEAAEITKLQTRVSTAEGNITKLRTDLTAEATTARAAEKANADAIKAEKERAMAAEKANADAIASEVVERGKAITNAINALDATVAANITTSESGKAVTSGKHVGVEVIETDGKLANLTVLENDIASAKDLSTLSGKVTTMDGSLGTAKTDIAALKALHADGEGNTKKSVKTEITEAIAKIQKGSTTVGEGKVTVTYSQANGIVSMQVAEDDIASASELAAAKTGISNLEGRATKLEALHAAGTHNGFSTVAEEVTAGINTLNITKEYDDVNSLVNAKVVEANGKITEVSLNTTELKAEITRLDTKIETTVAGAMVWEEF